jgi:hypothetical protein
VSRLGADRGELTKFINALFVYSDPETYASLRAFDQFQRGVAAEFIRPIQINGSLEPLIEAAIRGAEDAANNPRPIVFAPPICTFSNPERARVEDLANGLTLSVEIDDGDIGYARRRLESILGPATVIVLSGSDWEDPHTGEIQPKMHIHWRLSEPTREAEDHDKLRHARELATMLAGADPTGKPVVHPLRWPGSWNQKSATARLATIESLTEAAEIHLDDALAKLQEAVEAAGMGDDATPRKSGAAQAPLPRLRSAMAHIPNAGIEVHYDTWIMLGYACWRATATQADGYDLWDMWSRKSEKYTTAEQEAAWRRIGRAVEGSRAPKTVGAGTIFFHAARAGWDSTPEPPPDDSHDPGWLHSLEQSIISGPSHDDAEVPPTSAETSGEPPQLDGRIINPPLDWTAPAPLREWIVDGWIPRGYVTGLYGDGGAGKSLLAQQLLTSCSCATDWLGMSVHAGRAFGLMCEDDAKELHRRQEAINRGCGVYMVHLENLRLAARFGYDNLLMTFDEQNRGKPTALFSEIGKFLLGFHPTLIVLDTLADIFGGNEIVRAQARQFVQGIGGQLARQFNCGVVVCAHPSAAGLSSGQGTGGSTAWSNTFRSRLYMTRVEGEGNDDVRHLSRMKANYAPKGAELVMRWQDGAFQTTEKRAPSTGLTDEFVQAIFTEIERRWNDGDPSSNSPQTKKQGRYVPLWAAVMLGVQEKYVAKKVDEWLAQGLLQSACVDAKNKTWGLKVVRRPQP